MEYQLNRTVAPIDRPVTLAQARAQCGLPASSIDWNDELLLLIDAATDRFEQMTRRALLTQTWAYERHRPQVPFVELPRVPTASVTTVESKDELEDDWVVVADPTDYHIELTRRPARISWNDNVIPNYVRVVYVCGVATEEEVPAQYKHTILQMVCMGFENRGDTNYKTPMALEAMIKAQRAGTVAGYWRQ